MALALPLNLDLLDWKLLYDPTQESSVRKVKVGFGDNYVETRVIGLNPINNMITCQFFVDNATKAVDIYDALLRTGAGFVYFTEPHKLLATGLSNPSKWEVMNPKITSHAVNSFTIEVTLSTFRS